jgi:hypothetical protein
MREAADAYAQFAQFAFRIASHSIPHPGAYFNQKKLAVATGITDPS